VAGPVKPEEPLVIYIGDRSELTITNQFDDDAAMDIDGREYGLQVRSSSESSVVFAEYTCSISDATNGIVNCFLTPSETSLLKPGNYVADLQETISEDEVTTLVRWRVEVVRDVTR
jgi:hypothetical protein